MAQLEVCPLGRFETKGSKVIRVRCAQGRVDAYNADGFSQGFRCLTGRRNCRAYLAASSPPPTRLEIQEQPTTKPSTERERAQAEAARIKQAEAARKASGKTGNPIFDISEHDKAAAIAYARELKNRQLTTRGGGGDTINRDLEAARKDAAAQKEEAERRSRLAKEAATEIRERLKEQDRIIRERAAETARKIRECEERKRRERGTASTTPPKDSRPAVSSPTRPQPDHRETLEEAVIKSVSAALKEKPGTPIIAYFRKQNGSTAEVRISEDKLEEEKRRKKAEKYIFVRFVRV